MDASSRVLAVLLGACLLFPATAGAATATTGPALRLPPAATPVNSRTMPIGYDPAAAYEAQSLCDAAPKPGTRALAALIRRTYGADQSVGMTRACNSGGTSEHKDGRALDWMTSARSPRGMANAKAFLAWLLGPDQAGVPAGNATRLGVMYIGWNDRFWAAYDPASGWTELKGCFATPGAGSDTTCHRNHIHISLTWDGASGRTSFWDGTALAPYCSPVRSGAVMVAGGRAAEPVGIAPFRVLSTREGLGLATGSAFGGGWGDHWGDHAGDGDVGDGQGAADVDPLATATPTPTPAPLPATPCRLRAGGWRGDLGGILTKVTGQGGVPETGVAAVAVTVTALGSTAPAQVSVWVPGQAMGQPVVRVRMNGRGTGTAIVPVASDGTIAVGTSAGATDIIVEVTAYYPGGDQPNTLPGPRVDATQVGHS